MCNMHPFSIVKCCMLSIFLVWMTLMLISFKSFTNTPRQIINYTPVNNLMFQKTVSYGLIFKDLALVGSASVRLVNEGLFG